MPRPGYWLDAETAAREIGSRTCCSWKVNIPLCGWLDAVVNVGFLYDGSEENVECAVSIDGDRIGNLFFRMKAD